MLVANPSTSEPSPAASGNQGSGTGPGRHHDHLKCEYFTSRNHHRVFISPLRENFPLFGRILTTVSNKPVAATLVREDLALAAIITGVLRAIGADVGQPRGTFTSYAAAASHAAA